MESLITSPQGERAPARRLNHVPESQFVRIRKLAEHRKLLSHGALLAMALAAIPMALGRIGDGLVGEGLVSQWSPGYVVPPGNTLSLQADSGALSAIGPGGGFGVPQNWNVTRNTWTDDGAAAATDEASATPEETAVPAQFSTHEIVAGDTLNAIAEQYGVSIDYLLWNNPLVGTDPDSLIIGQTLMVPGTAGLVYDVRLGDTINDIAARYGVDPSAVVAYAPNNLASPDMISEGMVIVLPGAVPPAPPAVLDTPDPAIDSPVNDTPVAVAALGVEEQTLPVPAGLTFAPEPVATYGFIWPASGSLNSYFGPRWGSFHTGIDIGAGHGEAIVAAGSGQVILSTYSENGYGNYVIVKHADGSQTLYAHMSERYVSLGQWVSQGELLGAVGCTGWCTGTHLHFEVQIGGSAVDPLGYLP